MSKKLAIMAVGSGLAVLASVVQGMAACISPPLSQDAIDRFKSNPAAIVADVNTDARTIEGAVRDIAGTDASLSTDLVRLARNGTPRVRTAVAAGLAQAALACSTSDQQAAQLIQTAVAEFEDSQFQSVFAAVAGDLSTAATSAATSAAAASTGSIAQNNPVGGGGTGAQFTAPAVRNFQTPNFVGTPSAITVTSSFAASPSGSTSGTPVSQTQVR